MEWAFFNWFGTGHWQSTHQALFIKFIQFGNLPVKQERISRLPEVGVNDKRNRSKNWLINHHIFNFTKLFGAVRDLAYNGKRAQSESFNFTANGSPGKGCLKLGEEGHAHRNPKVATYPALDHLSHHFLRYCVYRRIVAEDGKYYFKTGNM